MKRLFIICHKDHLVSGSYVFFEELLESEFSVEIVAYDYRLHFIETLIKSHPDATFFLFQTEFLAPWLITQGLKTVVFPMFDGCANAPLSYFRILDNAYLFNFSKQLHAKCVEAEVVSYQLNYYPPVRTTQVAWPEKQDRLFYWLRRPGGPMPEKKILELFSPHVGGFHIHDRPDEYRFLKFTSRTADGFASTSDWFDDRQELTDLVANSKFYVAPRVGEGIGMAFLEAMAMGCVVFANNNSTHDQYIYHGHNGFLIDFESRKIELIRAQIRDAFEIIRSGKPVGENAREFMRSGRPGWEQQAQRIRGMTVALHDAAPGRTPGYSIIERILGRVLAQSYYYIKIYGYYPLSLLADKVGSFSPLIQSRWYLRLFRAVGKPAKAVFRKLWRSST